MTRWRKPGRGLVEWGGRVQHSNAEMTLQREVVAARLGEFRMTLISRWRGEALGKAVLEIAWGVGGGWLRWGADV